MVEEFPEYINDCGCPLGIVGIRHIRLESCEDAEPDTQTKVSDIFNPEKRERGRPPKEDDNLTDPISAGRKRAAAKVKIDKGDMCEWSMLKAAGGGRTPITGCPGYPATDLHHGPNKSTLCNDRPEDNVEHVNLHKICARCHNRWHAINDRFYESERPVDNSEWLPTGEFEWHDPVTKEDAKMVFAIEAGRFKEKKERISD